MAEAFQLIVISPEHDLPGEESLVAQLFEKGLLLYHLRKPGWTLKQAGQFLGAIPKPYLSRIVIHSHFELASAYALKGIHLNEENKKNPNLFSQYKVISASFHSFADMLSEKFTCEYVFLSPVFDSISKPGYKAGSDLQVLEKNLHTWRQERNRSKIIALGGIHAGNISIVRQLGFSGAAVVGAIWNSINSADAFVSLQSALQPA